jgi:predicted 3-demethylubiquinone-9 3-methyltransferase (glyoxalase superfamily)
MARDGFTTCLWFDGQAEEAANYYTSIFRDSNVSKTAYVSEAGPAPAGSVLAVEFELNGQKFVGINGGPEFTFNEAISFQVFCKDQDEIDYYWNASPTTARRASAAG